MDQANRASNSAGNPVEAEVAPAAASVEGPGDRMVPVFGIVTLMVYNMLLSVFLVLVIVKFWPEKEDGEAVVGRAEVSLLAWQVYPGPEQARFILVTAAGALGSIVHVLRSLGWYVGNREFKMSWMARYFLQPFTGGGLALLFYLIVRGGFFSMDAGIAGANPFGFAALGGIVGLFSDQALLKLKKIAEEVFLAPERGRDAAPQSEAKTSGDSDHEPDEPRE